MKRVAENSRCFGGREINKAKVRTILGDTLQVAIKCSTATCANAMLKYRSIKAKAADKIVHGCDPPWMNWFCLHMTGYVICNLPGISTLISTPDYISIIKNIWDYNPMVVLTKLDLSFAYLKVKKIIMGFFIRARTPPTHSNTKKNHGLIAPPWRFSVKASHLWRIPLIQQLLDKYKCLKLIYFFKKKIKGKLVWYRPNQTWKKLWIVLKQEIQKYVL